MIDRHAVHALLKAGHSTQEVALQFGVARRTIQRIAKEAPVDGADDADARRRRGRSSIGLASYHRTGLHILGPPSVRKRRKNEVCAHLPPGAARGLDRALRDPARCSICGMYVFVPGGLSGGEG